MSKVLRPSDVAAIVGVINPVSQGAGAVSTAWVDMSKFDRLLGLVQSGVLGAGATLDAKFEQATTSGGAGVKDVTGKAITQLTQAGADGNKQALINLYGEELDVTGGYRFARLTATVATAASLISGLVLGFNARYAPASDNDAASVDEIVA
jgi:hypothetical protein